MRSSSSLVGQVLEVVAVRARRRSRRPRPRRSRFQPSGQQAEEAPGERRRQCARQEPAAGHGPATLCLASTLTTTWSRSASPPCVDPLVQLPADLTGPLRSGQSKPAEQRCSWRRRLAPRPVAPSSAHVDPLWRSIPGGDLGGSSCFLDERGDELDDRPDLEVRLGLVRARLRWRVRVGRPRLDRRLGHQRLHERGRRRCHRVLDHPAVREVDLVLLTGVPFEVVDHAACSTAPRSSRSRPA